MYCYLKCLYLGKCRFNVQYSNCHVLEKMYILCIENEQLFVGKYN